MFSAYGCRAAASKFRLIPLTPYSLSRKVQARGFAYPVSPASTTLTRRSTRLIAPCEILTSFAYFRTVFFWGKNFDRVGSFQICRAVIGLRLPAGCCCW